MPNMLDIDAWERKEHFRFFKTYDNPFFNVCVEIDVTALRRWCAERDVSFFLASLYASLRAAEETEAFCYRLRGDEVVVHDALTAGTTAMRDNDTFGFAYLEPAPTLQAFVEAGRPVLEEVRTGRSLTPRPDADDLIHYSVLPWLRFTSFSHARNWGTGDSIPKIVFGAFEQRDSTVTMPVSVEVHHALMDGLHVAQHVNRFQQYCNRPEGLTRPR